MESLLRWGVENSNPEDLHQAQTAPRQPLDPGIIDHILGKPDAVQMKEALEIALDDARDEDERVAALDNFEMLIESMDNANDMTKLNMWTPLLSLLTSPSGPVVLNTLWILGTAVQNNPKAQADFLARDPIPLLLSALANDKSPEIRSKALYALSGALKHSEPAVARLEELDGWSALRTCLGDANLPIRRKAAFLFNSLLLPSAPSDDPTSPHVLRLSSTLVPTRSALVKHGLLDALLEAMISSNDEDLSEKGARVLLMFAQSGGKFEGSTRDRVKALVQQNAPASTAGLSSETWGMSLSEWNELRKSVQT
ncbi:Fes1-domain-containing protein [Exidia glandulosa HHB12029]|uniref:Fes1-domain-containing protein n=1 Tax=Exidia glandulosa HHB12029 TaxID=1314781 RepID=A0A165QAG3_EXIGL|nr:Fes1-domain-containing protein [Exidia glandulosa HHB12029]